MIFFIVWEQRKLGEWCDFINGDRSSNYPSAAEFVEDGIPFVGSDSLGSTLIDKTKLRFISIEKYEQMNGLKIETDDILYTLRGAGFGKCSIADFTGGTVASSLVGIRCKETLKSKFLIQWLSTSNADEEKSKAVNGSTAQNISVEDMKKYIVSVPSIAEQEKISEHFYNLDNLITLHQYLYILVCFSGFDFFTYSWEQRKFGDLYEKVTEKNDLSFGTDKIISVANMYYKEDTSKSDDDYMRTYNVMRLGDIAFEGNKSKNYAHGRFVENTIGDGIVSHVFDVFRPISEYDLLFWKYLINYEGVMGKIMVRCTKASTMMTNLVANDFLKESIAVPCIEEQRKIGALLEQLDNLITLHQCGRKGIWYIICKILIKMICFVTITQNGSKYIKRVRLGRSP